MANPTLLTMPLCVNADKNTIPPTDAGTSGLFSEELGFQDINSLPLASGGKAPNRRDFNGVFALLGGIAFYAQKGWVFVYDDTQEYFEGCMVRDPSDGLIYDCTLDVTAGQGEPHTNTTNWALHKAGLGREVIPAFNTRDVITTSGTYTAPVTGWYKITAKGGGGGGERGTASSSYAFSGGGGGEGGTTITYVYMTAGDTATVVIGGGGTGGTSSAGSAGGSTTVTIDGNTYTAGGGAGGGSGAGGTGGTGTINGCAGGSRDCTNISGSWAMGGSGGGAGGAKAGENTPNIGVNGGGGSGGSSKYNSSAYSGGSGGDGYVWFEYFATI